MVLVNSISGQPTVAGDKDAILEAFRPGTAPTSHVGPQIATATGDSQPDDDDSDPASPYVPAPGGPMPGGPMPAGAMAGAPMFPVNARLPIGAVVPPPPRQLMTGTGGLY
jgi:hypothetical protein